MAADDTSGREYWRWAGLGFEFAGVVAIFFYFGYLADQRYGTSPWGLLGCGAVGILGSGYLLVKEGYRMMRTLDRPDATASEKGSNGHSPQDTP